MIEVLVGNLDMTLNVQVLDTLTEKREVPSLQDFYASVQDSTIKIQEQF